MGKFKPLKARVRATFAADATEEPRLGRIDREALTLRDVQITLEGEARGHGFWLNRQFCEDVVKAGNAAGDAGVKVRFGHPAMCSDALGTYLGRATNFRCVEVTRKESGEKAAGVVADVALDAHADRTQWILDMSESAPDTFGMSIVFTYGDWQVLDADGVFHSYKDEVENEDEKKRKSEKEFWDQSADGRTYAVLGKLHGTDFTDTPAATDGVFSANDLASEAEAMLDEHPQVLETIEKHPDSVFQFLTRIGVMDRLETKRVRGIQAEKDRAVAELKGVVAGRDELLKKVTEKGEAEIRSLKDDCAHANEELCAQRDVNLKLSKELESLKGENERLAAAEKEAATALAETREQLERLRKKHEGIVGGALNAVRPCRTVVGARARLATMPIKERAEFYAAHKNEVDEDK